MATIVSAAEFAHARLMRQLRASLEQNEMPLLEFKCAQGHINERLYPPYKAEKVAITKCDQCGQIACRIISTPAAPQFKGTGFYATDYKGK